MCLAIPQERRTFERWSMQLNIILLLIELISSWKRFTLSMLASPSIPFTLSRQIILFRCRPAIAQQSWRHWIKWYLLPILPPHLPKSQQNKRFQPGCQTSMIIDDIFFFKPAPPTLHSASNLQFRHSTMKAILTTILFLPNLLVFGQFGDSPIASSCLQAGQIALSFDDGPSLYTGELLQILSKNDVSKYDKWP